MIDIFSRAAGDKKILWAFGAALTLIIFHYFYSGYEDFSQDTGGHLDYIRYMAEGHILPPRPYDCWECHQPPLYYFLAGIFYRIGMWTGFQEPAEAVRLLSLIFFFGFAAYGFKFLRETIRHDFLYAAIATLFVLWPTNIFRATQISNDLALAMTQVATFYYLARWWKNPDRSDLQKALTGCGVAVLFKNSGIILFPIVAAIVLLRRHEPVRDTLKQPKTRAALALALLMASLTFGRIYYYYRVEEQRSEPLMVPSASLLGPEIRLSNDSLYYYLSFDFDQYSREPFMFHGDIPQAHYFWNNFFKSAVLGEFHWKPQRIALAIGQVELMMILYLSGTLLLILARRRDLLYEWLPMLLFIAIQLGALISFRMQYPYSCHQDFRFIHASLVPLTALYGLCIGYHHDRQRQYLAMFGVILIAAMCGLTAALYLTEDLMD